MCKEKERLNEARLIEKEHKRLAKENAWLLDFVYLAAASVRLDGTYNNCRKALEQKAKDVLDKIHL